MKCTYKFPRNCSTLQSINPEKNGREISQQRHFLVFTSEGINTTKRSNILTCNWSEITYDCFWYSIFSIYCVILTNGCNFWVGGRGTMQKSLSEHQQAQLNHFGAHIRVHWGFTAGRKASAAVLGSWTARGGRYWTTRDHTGTY